MFDLLFRHAPPDMLVEVAHFTPGNVKMDGTREFYSPTKLPDVTGETNCFFGPALRKSASAEREACWGSRVVWVDVDAKDGTAAQPTPAFPPSVVVMSGRGYHLYWLLDVFCTDTSLIESINKILIEDTDADPACWNINRVLRIPGTINSKNGALSELRLARPVSYSVDDFRVLQALTSKVRHKIRTGDKRGYPSRSERDWSIITALADAGATDELIATIFQFQPCGDKVREENGTHYFEHTLKTCRERSTTAPGGGKIGVTIKKTPKPRTSEIVETDEGYYIERSTGRRQLATFVLDPVRLLESIDANDHGSVGEDALVCDVIANGHTWPGVMFRRSSFNSRSNFDKCLTIGAWVFLGRDDDVRQLLPHLMKRLEEKGLPKAKATSILGRHGPYFVGIHTTLDKNQVYRGEENPIMYLPTSREAPPVPLLDGDLPDDDMLDQLLNINVPGVTVPAFGWFHACALKPQLEDLGLRFPILNVFGTRGSGKTSLLKLLQRLMGYQPPMSYDCTTTRFVALALMGSTNSIPISFSEFRYSAGPAAERFLRLVLLAYDSGRDARGRGDQSTQEYPLIAPFTVDGEDIISDAAAKERIIALVLHPEDIAEKSDAWRCFMNVREANWDGYAQRYYTYVLNLNVPEVVKQARTILAETYTQTLPDRVRNNLTVVAVGVLSFCGFANRPLPSDWHLVLDAPLSAVWNDKLGRTTALVDEFTEDIVNGISRGRADFTYRVEGGGVIIRFQLSSAFQWWASQRRRQGFVVLERDAIRNQLAERSMTRGTAGQYTLMPEQAGNALMWGINLTAAKEAGLDIVDKIIEHVLTVKFKPT